MSEPGQARTTEGRPPHRWRALHDRLHQNWVTSILTKTLITLVGLAVIVVGIIMLVTPGPGLVLIAVGLGIWAIEWPFARRWVRWARDRARESAENARQLDPAVRRRRIALGLLGVVIVMGAVWWYVAAYGWPRLAVDGWDVAQSMAGFLPELPGM